MRGPLPRSGACKETAADSGVFTRDWGKATVSWDCAKGEAGGDIKMKSGYESEYSSPSKAGKGAWELEYAAQQE